MKKKYTISNDSTTVFFIFCLLYCLILVFKKFFSESFYQDEIHFFATTLLFSKQPIPSIELLQNYPELNTPVPFILGGWVINIFGANIQALRWLTFSISFIIVNLFIWFSPPKSSKLWWCLAGLWLFPNFYLCSVYFYTDMYAIIFVLMGVILYIKKKHFFSGVLFIIGICSRQYMLAFPVAILMYEAYSLYLEKKNIGAILKAILDRKYWIWYILAVLTIIPWLMLWGGFAPAAEMQRQYYDKISTYKGGFVLYVSSITAIYFVIPEALLSRKWNYYITFPRKNTIQFAIYVVIVLLVISFFPAHQTYNPYFTWPYLGYVDQGFTMLGLSGFAKQSIFGVLMLLSLMRFVRKDLTLSSWIFIINTLLLGKAQLSWDKYSMATIVLLWFLVLIEKDELELTPQLK